jgi:uncharacterized protein YfaA (DUF2138 family)
MDNTPRRRLLASRLLFGPVTRTLLAALFVVAAVGLYRTTGWARYEAGGRVVNVDLTRPDVLVHTRSLSSLTRDLLKIPLARDLLTEDFVFYYETHPDRLGLAGILRRISYEHDVSWSDWIVSTVFDEPAEVFLWRGPKGSLDYWALAMSRGALGTIFQEAALIAARDRQLSVAGDLTVDGVKVTIYALEYGARRTLLIAARGDRVVVLSHPGMLEGRGGENRAVLARLLSRDEGQRAVYGETYPPDSTPAPLHAVTASLHFLSFGYQRFFPGIEAVRFDFGNGRWGTHVLLNDATLPRRGLNGRDVWAAVPAKPAFCALLPVDWAQCASIAERGLGDATNAGDLAARLDGPAVVCWYEQGRVHTPLVAATLKDSATPVAPLLTTLFNWGVARPDKTDDVSPRTTGDETVWERELTVPFSSIADDSGRPEPAPLRATLAAKGRHLFFSADGEQVERALATVSRQFPSVADTLPDDQPTLAFLSAESLATLGRQESLFMLPRADEPVFRAAAEARLVPRLDALAKYPAYRLVLPADRPSGRQWQAVRWQEIPR